MAALLSLSIAASSAALTGCEYSTKKENDDPVKTEYESQEEIFYLIEIKKSRIIVHEVKEGVFAHQSNLLQFENLDGDECFVDLRDCIVATSKEQAEYYCEEFRNQSDMEIIWIHSKENQKTR